MGGRDQRVERMIRVLCDMWCQDLEVELDKDHKSQEQTVWKIHYYKCLHIELSYPYGCPCSGHTTCDTSVQRAAISDF